MSRARGRKQQDTRDFFAENPEAFDFDTQLSVVNNSGRFEVQAEGSKGVLRDYDDEELVDPLITLLSDLDTHEADFDFLDDGGEDDFLTLTEYGFGIIGEDEDVIKEGDDGEDVLRNTAEDIREDEVLEVDFQNRPYPEKEGPEEQRFEPSEVFGGTAVNIDFMVPNKKSGTVQLFINDGEEGPDQLISFDVGADNKGLQENVGFVMPDGEVFSGFDFTVIGDVRVSVTGIEFSSNYDGIFDVP